MLGEEAARRSLRSNLGSCRSESAPDASSNYVPFKRRKEELAPAVMFDNSLLLKNGNASAKESDRGRSDPG